MPALSAAERNAIWVKDRVATMSDGTPIAYTVIGPERPAGRADRGSDRGARPERDLGAEGPATPVVFMNGWTCPDAYWARIAPPIVDHGHPALFFDTRGHGQSGLPRRAGLCARHLTDDDVSVNRVARDIVEVLDHAGIERAVLVGHSMGVQGIFEVWRVAPERVAGIVPVAGTFENPVPTFASTPALDKLFPIGNAVFSHVPFALLRPLMGQAHRMPEGMTMKIVGGLLRTAPSVTYADIERHVRQIGDADFSVLWRMMAQMREHSAADLLPTITAPVLILGGERDHFTPPAVQHRLHDLLPDSELVMFPDGGHLLPVEEADGIAAALTDWLTRRVA